jgi:hypothetical protein
MLMHLTAHALGDLAPLREHELASLVWARLRRALPVTFAACLMPNHLHLVTDVREPERAQRRLAAILGGAARARGRLGTGPLWHRVPTAEPVRGGPPLERVIRYVVLNPCRAKLARDPLEWLWTTHRDIVGAVVDPWVTPEHVARAVGDRRPDFLARHHAFVSADRAVCVAGTAVPRRTPPSAFGTRPLPRLAAAAAAATRSTLACLEARTQARHLFVLLAQRDGWGDTHAIAAWCQITPRAVRALRRPLEPTVLAAGVLCAGDDRLVRYLASCRPMGAAAADHVRVDRHLEVSPPTRPQGASVIR